MVCATTTLAARRARPPDRLRSARRGLLGGAFGGLLLAPPLVVRAQAPVAGDRRPLLGHAAFAEQVPADVANESGLAVDEGVHLPVGPLGLPHGGGQVVAPRPVQPSDA